MNKSQVIILFFLIFVSSLSWTISKDQPDMMYAMMTYDPIAILLFTVSWTIGMAAMMFPSISPMILFYSRLIRKQGNDHGNGEGIINGGEDTVNKNNKTPASFVSNYCKKLKLEWKKGKMPFTTIPYVWKISLFVVCYLLVWTVIGIILLFVWSIPMNAWAATGVDKHQVGMVYGILLIVSGAYQFTPLKKTCLSYCESPLSFFMRHWKSGIVGAFKMGIYHGTYCLGCCWPYFLLMVALGWMNILWMALFAGIIFAEKIFSKGIYIARITGVIFIIIGLISALGMISISNFSESTSINKDLMSDNKMALQTLDSSGHNSTRHMAMNMNIK
jgi:predicted metal-binding membrane protein